MTMKTVPLAPGDFVSSGNLHGKVSQITEDGETLVNIYSPENQGWKPTLDKQLLPTSTLTRIAALAPPKSESTRMRVVNRTKDSAELLIYADIGEGWFGGLSSKEFGDQLSTVGAVKNLDVRINSAGGDVFEGITMYNRLKQHDARVTVYVDGLAASIASIIAMAADEIVVYDSSTVMIHKPLTYTGGNADKLRETIDRLDMVEAQMLDIYTAKTGLGEQHVADLLAGETWMTAEEALNLGFADRLEETTTAMAAAIGKPNLDRPWFANAPKRKSTTSVSSETIRRAKAQSASLITS